MTNERTILLFNSQSGTNFCSFEQSGALLVPLASQLVRAAPASYCWDLRGGLPFISSPKQLTQEQVIVHGSFSSSTPCRSALVELYRPAIFSPSPKQTPFTCIIPFYSSVLLGGEAPRKCQVATQIIPSHGARYVCHAQGWMNVLIHLSRGQNGSVLCMPGSSFTDLIGERG